MKNPLFMIPVITLSLFTSCNELKVSEDDDDGGEDGGTNAVFMLTGFSVTENAVINNLKPSIVVSFNKTVDAASVTGSAVTLDSGGTQVSLVLTVSGAQITAVPQLRLEGMKAYTLTVGTAVKDSAAANLAAAAVLHFSVTDPNNAVYVSAAGSASNSGLSPEYIWIR